MRPRAPELISTCGRNSAAPGHRNMAIIATVRLSSAEHQHRGPSKPASRAEAHGRVVGHSTRSAFAGLVREGQLTIEQRVTAIRLLGQLRLAWDEILPTEKVRSLAEDLPDTHGVRAADAAQLAAALVWCRERPKQRPFVCFDERLK